VKLLVATRSRHKMEEIRRILSGVPGLELLSMDDAGIEAHSAEEELEPHETFEANARSKARYFQARSGLPTVADDSGLEVDALGGAPGVRTKRFAPVPAETPDDLRDRANNQHLLQRLEEAPIEARRARYVCVVALDEGGPDRPVTLRGEAEGVIALSPTGRGGFGYDPLFLDPELGRTFAEISAEEKNARSHRGRAFRKLASYLQERRSDD
jgi:XTP/dITP diphosphohydrolase